MAKTKISEYSSTANNNTDINSINLAEGMAPSLVNNAIRTLMAQLKNFQDGSAGDNVTVGGNLYVTGTSTMTGAITASGGLSGNLTSSSATITGGTINGAVIGGSSAQAITGTNVTATVGFTGALTGNVTGNTTGTHTGAVTGNVTGNLTGNVTGNVTAASGTSTFNNVTISGSLDMDAGTSATITGLANPVNDSDAANKGYVDALAQGIDAKASVVVATTANITLSGTQTIDGIAVSVGDRVLVKDQSTASQNGIYLCASSTWTRTTDANTWDELVAAFTFVEKGTTQANNGYIATITAGGTLGTTAVTFAQFSGAGQITAGDGLTKTGNTLNVGTASSSRIVVNADNIDLATSGVTTGTYKSVTADAYGRITAGTNPTTLSGFGITDAYTIAQIDTLFGSTTSAATSAAAAATSASNAATSETNASTSAGNASSSATAAAASATAAASSYDQFDDRYLGSKSSAPTVDNDGNALLTGALYWNTSTSELYLWTGSTWTRSALSGADYVAKSGDTMTGALTTTGLTISGGTANGVAYLNGSKVLTTGSALTFDGSSLASNASVNGTAAISVANTNTGVGSSSAVFLSNDATTETQIFSFGANRTGSFFGNDIANYSAFLSSGSSSNGILLGSLTSKPVIFGTNNAERVRIASTGALGLSGENYGTSGQVLTSGGSGAAPTWSSVSAGAFGTDLSYVDYSLTTSSKLVTAVSETIYSQSVSLDGTSELMIFSGDSSTHAVVFNTSTNSFGTPVLVRTRSMNSIKCIALAKISSTEVLVCSLRDTTTDLQTVVLTVSGSTITVNTAVATTLSAGSSFVPVNTRLVKVGSSYVLNYYNTTGTTPKFRAITVSGTTPSVGSELAYTGGGTASAQHHSYAYSSSVLLSFSMTASSTVYAYPITVSGTTLTGGTAATKTTNASSYCTGVLSTGRVALLWAQAGGGYTALVSVSGTTATITEAANLLTVDTWNPQMQVFSNQAFVLSGTSAADQISVLTDTAGTPTTGVAVTVPAAGSFTGYLSAGNIFFSGGSSGSTNYYVYGISSGAAVLQKTFQNVTNTSVAIAAVPISYGYNRPLSGPPQSASGNTTISLRTSTGKTSPGGTGATNYFSTSIDGTYPAKLQQAANPFISYNDGISEAVVWGIPTSQSSTTTTLQLRKVTLS